MNDQDHTMPTACASEFGTKQKKFATTAGVKAVSRNKLRLLQETWKRKWLWINI